MKTTVLFRMIVLVAMVFAGIANTTVKAQGNNFITNEEKVDDLVVSKVIYRLDGSLYRHMKYDLPMTIRRECPPKKLSNGMLLLKNGYRISKLIILIHLMKSLWYMHAGMTLTELTTHLLKRAFMN